MTHYITLNHARNVKKHYENFPVASMLFPKKQREAAIILYQFARACDDIADEGTWNSSQRTAQLQYYKEGLDSINTKPSVPLFVDIKQVCHEFNLQLGLLYQLMTAFEQDIAKDRYHTMSEVIDYCNKAACPAGEMILTLFGKQNKTTISLSNHLCIALAMIGMLQDIHEDFLKNRIYIPQEYFKQFNVTEAEIHRKEFTPRWSNLKDAWLTIIDNHIDRGESLKHHLTGRLKLQIKVLIGASRLLSSRMKLSKDNLFVKSPTLSKWDWGILLFKAIIRS